MATGLTQDIYDGKNITFKQFVMKCARAMGACIMMKDDDMNAPIPEEFPVDPYHLNQIEEANDELKEVMAWSEEQATRVAVEEYQRAISSWNESVEEKRKRKVRYERMLVRVNNWVPPTSEHERFKTFMQNQLTESIDWDCRIYEDLKPVLRSGAEYKQDEINTLYRNIEYHTKKHKEEVERTKSRNQWIKDLRESLV